MNDIFAITIILCGSILLIYIYGVLTRELWFDDDMMHSLLIPDTDIDYWSLAHLILFTFLGYYFPLYIPYFIVLGVIWEGIENATGNPDIRRQFVGDGFKGDKYWYAKISDIFIDILGLSLGLFLLSCRQ